MKKKQQHKIRKMHFNNKHSKKVGMPPGSLMYTGEARSETVAIELIEYDAEQLVTSKVSIETIQKLAPTNKIRWIKIYGLHDLPLIELIGKMLHVDSLYLEDVLNTGQRAKVETMDDMLFLTMHSLKYAALNNIVSEQISIILKDNILVSFQENNTPLFAPIDERLKKNSLNFKKKGIDYLLYTLVDFIVDNYFIVMDHFADDNDALEDELFNDSNRVSWAKLQAMRESLLFIKKSIFPFRDAVNILVRGDTPLIQEVNVKYFSDVRDHLMQVYETIETYRDLNAGLKDMYLSNLSNRMNQIMKVLTIISTIFIPITFIVGVYGMNFSNIPEFQWENGYYIVWSVMLLIVIAMLLFFRKKKWL